MEQHSDQGGAKSTTRTFAFRLGGGLLLEKRSPKPDSTGLRTGLSGSFEFYRTAIIFYKSSCAFGLLFLRSNRVHDKRQVIFRKQSSFRGKSILHDRLALIALSTLRKAKKSSQAQARWLNKRENKTFLEWQQQIRIAC